VADLSVLIPARNEEWLGHTVADVLAHTSDRTEIIVVLDGAWSPVPLPQHDRLTVVYLPQPIGQRAATNLAARLSTAKYICKLDAHCSVAPGFDTALMDAAKELGSDVTQIPKQFNLHIWDYVCEDCGRRDDQSPVRTECLICGSKRLRRDIVWQTRTSTTNWTLDSDLRFCYASDKKQQGDICDVMSSLGACFFMERERFWQLGGLDEAHGSWGQFGAEIACKSWLSGGRHVVNKRTWFAHFFRVGGHGFPYEIHHGDQEAARAYSRNLWRSNGWAGQVKPFRWLVEKFAPSGWTKEQIEDLPASLGRGGERGRPVKGTAGIVYYSDNRPDERILEAARASIEASGLPITAVVLNEGFYWPAAENVSFFGERGYLTMFRQILAGLEALDTDYAFLAEHDVLYHSSHWDFVPPNDSTYYYNVNTFKVDAQTGRAVTYVTKQTSGLCANRRLLLDHYRKRVAIVERDGFSRRQGFEPGSHRRAERIDDIPSDVWRSEYPNLDIRHAQNLTSTRWSPEQFRDKRNCQGWQEVDTVPGWGRTVGRMDEILGRACAAA
jgi:glycosyltransferase involved in cell wall biosynthesis